MCAAPVDGRGCHARIIVSPKNMKLELALNNIEQAKIAQLLTLKMMMIISMMKMNDSIQFISVFQKCKITNTTVVNSRADQGRQTY